MIFWLSKELKLSQGFFLKTHMEASIGKINIS
jgi:hypothetical protein